MPRHGGKLWKLHPHVNNNLTLGERASDALKHWFGTWTILGLIAAGIILWLLFIKDPGDLHLNLILSCMAAVQGIILQISANRQDKINAEASVHHAELQDEIRNQTALITEVHKHVSVLAPHAGDFNA